MLWNIIGVVGGSVFGFIVGMLVMRNNYKHFAGDVAEIKLLIAQGELKAEELVSRIRGRLGI